MKFNRAVLLSILSSLCFSGCFTLSDTEIRQLQRSILDTHRRVARLEETTSRSLEEIRLETRRTRADVDESLKNALEEMRKTGGQVDENTYYIRELTTKLDEIVYSLHARPGGTPQESIERPAEATDDERKDTAEEATTDTEEPSAPPPLLTPVSPQDDYRRAKRDYDKGNLELAKLEFEEYLRLYPDSELAPNAQFWLAECYFKSGDLRQAVREFKKVYTEFPQNNKMADAILNEAYAHLRLGENEEGVRLLKKVISEYAVTPAAQSAKIKLEALGASGGDTSDS